MKKIFITGVSDISNQGNFAMFKVLIENINQMSIGQSYVLETDNVGAAKKTMLDLGVENIEIIPDYFSVNSKSKAGLLLRYCSRLLQYRFELIKKRKHSVLLKKLCECNVIINIGGDTLSHSSGQFNTLTQLDKLLLGKYLGLKTAILAHTLGKYRNPYRALILHKMAKIDLVTVRENLSFNYVSSLGYKEVIRTSDLSFLLEPTDYVAKDLKLEGMGKFGCFVPSSMLYKKTFSDLKSLDRKYQAYLEIARYIIDSLLKKGLRVLLLPHVYVKSYRDDLNAKEIKENLYPDENKVVYLNTQFYAHEIKEIIKHSKCVVSLRMHPTISAISQRIPCFLMTDTHKGKGILGELLPEHFVINCSGLSQGELEAKVKTYLPNFLHSLSEIKSRITQDKIKKLRKAAKNNFILLNKVIQEKSIENSNTVF